MQLENSKIDRISLKNSSLFYDVVASGRNRTYDIQIHVHNESARNATTTIQAAILVGVRNFALFVKFLER
jgi:hypothetical protein